MENGTLKISRLAIEITNICNANCSFCAYKYMKRSKRIISNEDFRYLVEAYDNYGGGELKFTPIVGDPLVDKNFIEKIKIARWYPNIRHMYTYTNLIGLSNFNVNDLILSGINKIDISTCLADKEMYKRLYGVDKYDEVMSNLIKLFETNLKYNNPVKINVLVRCDKPYDETKESSYYKKLVEDFSCMPRLMENWDNWGGFIKEEDLPKGQKFRVVEDMSEPCSLLYRGVIILNNGDVGACWCRDFEGMLIIGNIFRNTLDEIWNGEKLKMLRDNWIKGAIPQVCKNCYQYSSLSSFCSE
jgi:radical SAM protein with 4Fe4S-binding SPASM domain